MRKRYVLLGLILLLAVFLSWLNVQNFTIPRTYGHTLIASKGFTNVSYNTTEVLSTLEANGWTSRGGMGRSLIYLNEEGIDLRFTPFSESQFAIDIYIAGKDEKKDREELNQTLDELHQLFGWDMTGFKTHFSYQSD